MNSRHTAGEALAAVGANSASVAVILGRLGQQVAELAAAVQAAHSPMLSTEQVLKRLGLKDRRALGKRWQAGYFPKPIINGTRWRWRLEDVLAWELENQR